jgi:hypothetical protein
MLLKFRLTKFTCVSWASSLLQEVEASPLEDKHELVFGSKIMCLASLWLRGLRGKKSTPNIG